MTVEARPPLVTLAVFAYRQQEHIEAAVEAAFAQTCSPLQIILSDDCSPDDTFAIMTRMAEAYGGPHRIMLNRNLGNLGIGGHVNRLMELAEGELVVIAAGDDISVPRRCARIFECWSDAGRPAMAAIYSAYTYVGEAEVRPGFTTNGEAAEEHPTSAMIRDRLHHVGAVGAWTRGLFERFGPLRPGTVLEDKAISFRAAASGQILYIDAPLVAYRRDVGVSFEQQSLGLPERAGRGRLKPLAQRLEAQFQYLDDMARAGLDHLRPEAERNIARLRMEIDLIEGRLGFVGALRRCGSLGLGAPGVKDAVRSAFPWLFRLRLMIHLAKSRLPRA